MSWENLIGVANSIIEGHLRGSLAQMTPEEVMSHKERLVKSMLQVCRGDLEAIGLEITTMNIADVEDHRFDGVEEPDLYIALLKRGTDGKRRNPIAHGAGRSAGGSYRGAGSPAH